MDEHGDEGGMQSKLARALSQHKGQPLCFEHLIRSLTCLTIWLWLSNSKASFLRISMQVQAWRSWSVEWCSNLIRRTRLGLFLEIRSETATLDPSLFFLCWILNLGLGSRQPYFEVVSLRANKECRSTSPKGRASGSDSKKVLIQHEQTSQWRFQTIHRYP